MTLGREQMDRTLSVFTASMRAELERNMHKPGWEDCSAGEMVEDLLYHCAKLAVSVHLNNHQAVREYAADVANEAMMVADCAGVLEMPQASSPVLIGDVVFDVSEPKKPDKSDGGAAAETLGDAARGFLLRLTEIARMRPEEWVALTEGKVG